MTKVSVTNRPSGGKVDATAGAHGPAGRKASAADHRHRTAEQTSEPP
ncbi:hypothetical protein ACKI1J_26150 [Streptomyces scabiei]